MNDKTAQRFGEVFRRFFETGYMDDLAELFQGESKVIVYLSTAEGIVYPSDISRDLMISRQRVTSVLSTMEKKGFVSLVRDPEDKRRVQVKLLPKGEKSIEEKQQRLENISACSLTHWVRKISKTSLTAPKKLSRHLNIQ